MIRAIVGIMNLFTPIGVLITIFLSVTKFKIILTFAKNFYNLEEEQLRKAKKNWEIIGSHRP